MEHGVLMEWVIGGGGLLALFLMVFKSNSDNSKKVGRVYERMDECKKDFEIKYTSKDVCSVLHKTIKDDVAEIKLDVKELLGRKRV